MRILIAEDNLVSRNFLSRFFYKYGVCDLVVDGMEALDAFLMAIKDEAPYRLVCLDIMMPRADGVKTLKAMRDLEKQYDLAPGNRAKIIMTTAMDEMQLVQTAFEYGCEAYALKPIDPKKLLEVLIKLELIDKNTENRHEGTDRRYHKKREITTKHGMSNDDHFPNMSSKDGGYYKSVRALPAYQLEVVMETGTTIHFDFRTKLNTTRFGGLSDEEFFRNVRTDGNYMIFEKAGKVPVKITAAEFMDLVLIDRRK